MSTKDILSGTVELTSYSLLLQLQCKQGKTLQRFIPKRRKTLSYLDFHLPVPTKPSNLFQDNHQNLQGKPSFRCHRSFFRRQSPKEIADYRDLWFLLFWVLLSCAVPVSKKMYFLLKSDSVHIREVWNDNLDAEFKLIRNIVDDYPYIAMDTEFPGIVVRPLGTFKTIYDYNYQTLKANVDLLKLIQLGLTLSDENGNLPACGTDKYCVWQFNFCDFNVNEDMHAAESIALLSHSGMDFKNNIEKGFTH